MNVSNYTILLLIAIDMDSWDGAGINPNYPAFEENIKKLLARRIVRKLEEGQTFTQFELTNRGALLLMDIKRLIKNCHD